MNQSVDTSIWSSGEFIQPIEDALEGDTVHRTTATRRRDIAGRRDKARMDGLWKANLEINGPLIYASPYGITRAIRRHLQALGFAQAGKLKPIHNFRAKWISDLYRHGFDLNTIKEGAGHKRIETTMGYLTDPGAKLKDAASVIGENWHRFGTKSLPPA